jgi:hypothetical protein
MLSSPNSVAHKVDVNWAPLTEVMVAGTPNLEIQPANRALAQLAVVIGGQWNCLRPP